MSSTISFRNVVHTVKSGFVAAALVTALFTATSTLSQASETLTLAIDDDAEVSSERLDEIFAGDSPASVAELAAMEGHFKELVDQITPSVVGVRVGQSQGSGVIISKDGYVLTAGHVVGKANLDVTFILPDGTEIAGKTLGVNFRIDSGLMKITDEGNWPYVDMGDSAELSQGQWVMAVGHPGGYEEGRRPVVRIGRVLTEDSRAIRTDCVLVGGDSGGPLFDMSGQVVGINSRIGNTLSSNIHVPVNTYTETWDRLASAEEWGSITNSIAQLNRPYIGVERDPESDEAIITKVTEDSPAEKAGIQAGDKITSFDGREITSFQSLRVAVLSKRPGDEVEIEVDRDGEILKLNLVVGEQ